MTELKLVPVEPTEEMMSILLDAGLDLHDDGLKDVYSDLLAAAPQQAAEPVGYVFRRSICSDHDPADCEEYDEFVSRADVDLEELAEYESHGMVMEVYAGRPPAQPETVKENGPWHAGICSDRSAHFVESDDFEHDVRLYIDGDFGSDADRALYAQEIARRLNQAKPEQHKSQCLKCNDTGCYPLGSSCLCDHRQVALVPEQAAPIPTIERLPTKADADCCGQVWALNPCTTRKWWVTHWTYLASNHRYTHWLPTGLTRPAAPDLGDVL